MVRRAFFLVILMCYLHSATVKAQSAPASTSSNLNSDLEAAWGLSPLNSKLRHRFEGIQQTKLGGELGELKLNVWYEDDSVTKGAKPKRELFCRLAHTLIFGKNRVRSSASRLPIDIAFKNHKTLDNVKIAFFTVIFRNRPFPPTHKSLFRANPTGDGAKLRVVWEREEKVVPYMTMSLNRQDWSAVASFLKGVKNEAFESFSNMHCDGVFQRVKTLKSDFQAVDAAYERSPLQPYQDPAKVTE